MKTAVIHSILLLSLTKFAGADCLNIPLAAIIPLTGNAADQGEWARRGFEIALEEVNSKKKCSFSLTYEDSKGGDPATAVQAYKALVAKSKPLTVFTYGSGVGMALSPLTNNEKIIQMGIATSTPKYSSPDDFTFRNFPSATLESDFLASVIKDQLQIGAVATFNINNDYGVGSVGAFKSAFLKHGGKILLEDSYNPGETDFKPQLLKLKRLNPAIVYLATYPTDGALLLKQAQELGIKTQFIASVAIIGGNNFFSLTGNSADGLLVASSIIDEESEFAKIYQQKYKNESAAQQIYAARAYDALKVIAEVTERCNSSDTMCIREQLSQIKDHPGAAGKISFDHNGDISTNFALFKIRQGEFQRVE